VLKLATAPFLAAAFAPGPAQDGGRTMKTRPLMVIQLRTGELQRLGAVPRGDRIVFPIAGGTFSGRLEGQVLAGGADWALQRPDGVMELDLRITLRAHDGALISMSLQGVRRADYFRGTARFETAAPQHAFLNALLAADTGSIENGLPTHALEEIL
jgi:hypothetical protein